VTHAENGIATLKRELAAKELELNKTPRAAPRRRGAASNEVIERLTEQIEQQENDKHKCRYPDSRREHIFYIYIYICIGEVICTISEHICKICIYVRL